MVPRNENHRTIKLWKKKKRENYRSCHKSYGIYKPTKDTADNNNYDNHYVECSKCILLLRLGLEKLNYEIN